MKEVDKVTEIIKALSAGIRPGHILTDEPMKNHTTFRIGGPADVLVMPERAEDIIFAVNECRRRRIPFYLIGNGSNLLVKDEGVRGVVIKTACSFKNIMTLDNGGISADSGVLLSTLANTALEAGYTGMEFASGIPGTLGGAIAMNAGAYGGEMSGVFESAVALDQDGVIKTIHKDEMGFGYRTSIVQQSSMIVLSAVLRMQNGERNTIKETMRDYNERRRNKQPLEMPSAGSTFRRPVGRFAGELIMNSGLRGYEIGGAKVSEKHCGFVVNTGSATARDVLELIKYIQLTVKNQHGVELEMEIKVIG